MRNLHYILFILLFGISTSEISASTNQKDMIVQMQNFAVQWEHLQNKNQLRRTTYLQLQNFLGQLMGSAVANGQNSRLCMYAGWLSYIPSNAGEGGKCVHPNNYKAADVPDHLKEMMATEQERYVHFRDKTLAGTCSSSEKIVCNPSLFGTQLEDDKPFCAVGNVNPENSSFQCLKKFETQSTEDRDQRLENIVAKSFSEGSQENLKYLMRIMSEACTCGASTYLINPAYARRMFETQTCFAWASQARNLAAQVCRQNLKDSTTNLMSFSANIQTKVKQEMLKSGIDDAEYLKIINGMEWSNTDWAKKRSDLAKLCKENQQENIAMFDTLPDAVVTAKSAYTISIEKLDETEGVVPVKATVTYEGEVLSALTEGLTIRWVNADDATTELAQGTDLVLDSIKKVDMPNQLVAQLMNGENRAAVSNPLDFSNTDTDDEDFKISISQEKAYMRNATLVAEISYKGETIDIEKFQELALTIKWFKKNTDPAAEEAEPKTGLETEEEESEDDEESEEAEAFEESSDSYVSEKLTTGVPLTVHATLHKADGQVAISNDLEVTPPKAMPPLPPMPKKFFEGVK